LDRLIADGERIQAWLHERSRLPLSRPFHGVAREVNGEIVAAFGYDYFQGSSCCMHLAADTPQALSRTLLYVAFAVPFEQWDYLCVLAIIQACNAKSLNIARHLGFREFARVEEAHPDGGLVFLKMTKEQCRWLSISGASKNNVRRRLSSSGTESSSHTG
jgi:RimJ/RimL family protein N-acetyltransferase